MAKTTTTKENVHEIERPPVVVVMGHIDHGKSKLLDYIRKSNVVEGEAGGITQHLSAYEVTHKNKEGEEKKITFLDTPGHEAFQKMRYRGAEVADIAILIVAADEGVKAQTLEAYKRINECSLPFVVAISKIDKPNANVEKTKNELLENGIYLENLGGDVPWGGVSSTEGTGVDELLDLVLLVAELEELKGSADIDAEGIIIEAHRDTKKGIAATLIIKNGTLKSGSYVLSGTSVAPVRIMEDFQGKNLKEASFSSPVQIIGFNEVPEVGASFTQINTKKDAERIAKENTQKKPAEASTPEEEGEKKEIIPIILKTDVSGSLDAIKHEFDKLQHDRVEIKIIQTGVGAISENDVKVAAGKKGTVILGFNTVIDTPASDLADRLDITIKTFDIIYKISEWIEEEMKKRAPIVETEEITGRAKILKVFSKTKNKQVVGGRVLEGELLKKSGVKILRKDVEIGRGSIQTLQQQKADVDKVRSDEFGTQIESKIDIAPGDEIESFVLSKK